MTEAEQRGLAAAGARVDVEALIDAARIERGSATEYGIRAYFSAPPRSEAPPAEERALHLEIHRADVEGEAVIAVLKVEVREAEKWVRIARIHHVVGGHTSHTIEPSGISAAIDAAMAGEKEKP